jgi:hypothetical protein
MTKPVSLTSTPLRLFEVWPNGQKPGRKDALHLRVYYSKKVATLTCLSIPEAIHPLFWEWALADSTYRSYVPRFPTQQAIKVLTSVVSPASVATYTLDWELIRRRDHVRILMHGEAIGDAPYDDLREICLAPHHHRRSVYG